MTKKKTNLQTKMTPRRAVGFPGGSDGKESACNAGVLGSIPGLGRSPGGGHGNSLQYSCLENPHGQRSLTGYSPWGHKELEMIERLSRAQSSGRKLGPFNINESALTLHILLHEIIQLLLFNPKLRKFQKQTNADMSKGHRFHMKQLQMGDKNNVVLDHNPGNIVNIQEFLLI